MRVLLFILPLLFTISLSAQKLHTTKKKAKEYYQEGRYWNSRKAFSRAEEQFRKALDKDEGFWEAWSQLGYTLYRQSRYREARSAYESLLDLAGKSELDTGIYYYIGAIWYQTGDPEGAGTWLRDYLDYSGKKTFKVDAERMMEDIQFLASYQGTDIAFSEPEKLPQEVNAFPLQYFPVLTGDSRFLLYTRRLSNDPSADEDIVVAVQRPDGGWYPPRSVSNKINTRMNEGTCTISADARTLIFTACQRPDALGSCDLYISTRDGNEWSDPKNLGPVINSSSWESQASLSADGRVLFFASDRPGGYGKLDIWKSLHTDDGWSSPTNLGPQVNTAMDDMSPSIHADGHTLFFASEGHPGFGNFDIYQVDLNQRKKNILNLGPAVNDEKEQNGFFVTTDGRYGYYSNFNRQGQFYQSSYIYRVELPEKLEIPRTRAIAGKVIDEQDSTGIKGEVDFRALASDSLIYRYQTNQSGDFLAVLPLPVNYGIFVSAKGYLSSFLRLEDFDRDSLIIPLEPIRQNATATVENIYFEFDSYQLEDKSEASLQELYRFLENNPDVRIQIEGHTDRAGDAAYNQQLSEKRAREVADHLIDMGLDEQRVQAVGYGETQPKVTVEGDERQEINRRIEIRIL